MSVYKDSAKNTWYVKTRYKTWDGETKWCTKRGFALKREALDWERDFLLRKSNSMDMCFSDFVKVYEEDRASRLKQNTLRTKENLIDTKILPYFGKMKMRDITSADVLKWQNKMLLEKNPETGKPYAKSYLRTMHIQLAAIFTHAMKYYHLPSSPAREVGNMGSVRDIHMKYWTKAEYLRFASCIREAKPAIFICFELLYWCGIREGELLALTPEDIDLEAQTLRINKTFNRLKGEDIITAPKTTCSNRIVQIPAFLCEELYGYLANNQTVGPDARLFPYTRSVLAYAMEQFSKEASVPKIRIHDLRHSHVSLLIDLGYSAVAIAERVGHKSIEITYRYAHLFPRVSDSIANKLNEERGLGSC